MKRFAVDKANSAFCSFAVPGTSERVGAAALDAEVGMRGISCNHGAHSMRGRDGPIEALNLVDPAGGRVLPFIAPGTLALWTR